MVPQLYSGDTDTKPLEGKRKVTTLNEKNYHLVSL